MRLIDRLRRRRGRGQASAAPSGSASATASGSSRLRPDDVLRLGTAGLRARPARAALSSLGIAIGIAAMIAVVGISASSGARLNEQLSSLGTNLLTASPGKTLAGEQARFSEQTVPRVLEIPGVEAASSVSELDIRVYRSRLSDPAASGAITLLVPGADLPDVVGAAPIAGSWFDAATAEFPTVVLGQRAAERLGVVSPGTQIWVGDTALTVIGILGEVPLAPELEQAAFVGAAAATDLYGYDGHPTTVYERSTDDAVDSVRTLLGPTISPENPGEVEVSRPSDALAAQHAADQAFTGLLVGLGSVALVVGGIGVANTMIISVLERRREIGLRRALGATRGHIRIQFVAEALLLSAMGGVLGAALGAWVTGLVAGLNGWPFALPISALGVGVAATLAIGAIAGLYPAVRAARTPPTAALNS